MKGVKMTTHAGYDNYKTQSVYTMTKGELLILLYDELLKRLLRAELSLDQGQIDGIFDPSIDRARDIVIYLKDTLNFQYEISRELERMYDYFVLQLARIQAGRKKELIQEMRHLVTELREAYQQAEKTAVY